MRDITQALDNTITPSAPLAPLTAIDSEYHESTFSAVSGGGVPGAKPAKKLAPIPHFLSKTTLKPNHRFRILFVLSVIVSFLYFAVRVIYLATGRGKFQIPPGATAEERARLEAVNTGYSLWWSCVVLIAELGGFVLVHVGQQMFTKQKTKFTIMTEENVARMEQVRTSSAIASPWHSYVWELACVSSARIRLMVDLL